MEKITLQTLRQRQAMPLELKERFTETRIRQWHEFFQGKVYVSFSGGKDSTVLLHQVRKIYPDVPAIFSDTGLEYPEIREFVKTIQGVVWVKPKMTFRQVIEKYGYPIISKTQSQYLYECRNTNSEKLRNLRLNGSYKGNFKISEKWKFLIDAPFKISNTCCDILKKFPMKQYEKETNRKPIIGIMAGESFRRETNYMKYGCNAFDKNNPNSMPLSFWTEKDVWEYIKKYSIPYSKIYDMGYTRTGCMFCMFGVHLEKGENRFQRMKKTHPKQWDYCINKLGLKKCLDFIKVKYE